MNLIETIRNLYKVNDDVDTLEEEILNEAVDARKKGHLSYKFGRKPDQNPYPAGSDDAKDWSAGYSAAKAAEKKRDPRYRAETFKGVGYKNGKRVSEKAIEESEKYQAKLVKKAIELAKRSSGNFDRAYDRIEKMKKGLGDHPMVARALKTANEGVEQYVDSDKLFEEELKEKFGPLAKAWQKGSKSVKSGDLEFVKGNRGSHTIKKNGKVIGDFSLDTDVDKWVANIKGQKGQLTVDDIDDFASQLKESVELGEDYFNVQYYDKKGKAVKGGKTFKTKAEADKYAKRGNAVDKVGGKYKVLAVKGRMESVEEEVELDEKWKKGKYVVKDKNDKVLGTYNSGSAASKAMNKLIDNGNYDELTVVLKEEVELEEGSISGVTKALGNLAKKPEYKKIANALNGLANPVNMPPKKQAGAINRRLKQLATKVDKKAGAKLLRIADLASTYESVEIEEVKKGQVFSKKEAEAYFKKEYGSKFNAKKMGTETDDSGVKYWMDKGHSGEAVPMKEEVELEEARFSKQQKEKAIKIIDNPKWKGGDMTKIVKEIEKIARGLSKDKEIATLIKLTNEDVDLDEAKLAGFIANFKGKKLEIRKNEVDSLYGAKKLAIKKLNVPKSQEGLLAIKPAYEDVEWDEERMDIIGQNGNTGEHYEGLDEAVSPGQVMGVAKAIASKVKGTIGQSDKGRLIVKAGGKRVVVGPSQSGEKISVALKAFDRREKGDAVAHGVNQMREQVEKVVLAKEDAYEVFAKGSEKDPMLFLTYESNIIASGSKKNDQFVFGFVHESIHPNRNYQPRGMVHKTTNYTHVGFDSPKSAISFAKNNKITEG